MKGILSLFSLVNGIFQEWRKYREEKKQKKRDRHIANSAVYKHRINKLLDDKKR